MVELTQRPRYFDRQLLGVTDFALEQAYDQTRRRLHNRLLHTWGLAEGLGISFAANATQASISPGTAFDNLGREIVLTTATLAPSVATFGGQTVFVTITYAEADTNPAAFNGVTDFTRTTETPRLQVSVTAPSNPGAQLVLGRLVVSASGTIASLDDGVEPNRRRLAGAAGLFPDQLGTNAGGLTPGLAFGGIASREGIASKRTSGGNQNGLDLYTNSAPRLSITNAGFVGIGTQTPGSSLQVEGDARVNGLVVDKGATNSGTLASALQFSVNSGEGIASKRTAGGNQYGLDLYAGSAPRLSITNTGFVGIGTQAPGAALQVEGDARVNGLYVDKNNTNNGGLSPALVFAVGSGEGISSKRTAGGNQYGLDFYTNGQLHMSLTQPGRLGINSAVPGAQLSVVAPGAGELWGTAASTTLRTSTGTLGSGAGSELPLASFGFVSSNSSSLGVRAIRVASGGDWTTTAIGLGMDVDNTVRVNASAVYLHANGNVGVGIATPQTRLHVYGDTRVDGRLRGDVTVEGRIGTNGQSPVPRTSGWAGGVHTWDLEVEGSAWCRNGWATGPRDLAEYFDAGVALEPGDVAAFDPTGDSVVRSSAPNDTRVCGVVSTTPGLLLNFDPELVGHAGRVPIALCGRVPCRVTDENGPIRPGDLLTSSSLPGHAMRAEPLLVSGQVAYRSGTVIGKALATHQRGTGIIDVFISPS